MKNYVWNIDKLTNQLKYLYTLLNNNKKDSEKFTLERDIENLQNLIEHFYEFKSSDDSSVIPNNINDDSLKINFNDYKAFYKILEVTSDILNYQNEVKIFAPLNRCPEELLTLTHDYYKSLNSKWYQLFLKIFNERENNLFFEKSYDSWMEYINNLDYSYILINKSNNVEEECDLTHEYAHAIAYSINPKANYNKDLQIIREVPSYFNELLALEFFKKNNGHNNEYNNIQKYILLINSQLTKDILDRKAPKEYFYYSFSYLIAIELLNIHNHDPEKAFYLLEQIITMPNTKILYNLEKMQIHPNEHLEEYQISVKKLK